MRPGREEAAKRQRGRQRGRSEGEQPGEDSREQRPESGGKIKIIIIVGKVLRRVLLGEGSEGSESSESSESGRGFTNRTWKRAR